MIAAKLKNENNELKAELKEKKESLT